VERAVTKVKLPRFRAIDLNKCCAADGGCGLSDHPDISSKKTYLVKIDGKFFLGKFSRQWYGWNFDDWGTSGIQLDKPGTNSSDWQGIWELCK